MDRADVDRVVAAWADAFSRGHGDRAGLEAALRDLASQLPGSADSRGAVEDLVDAVTRADDGDDAAVSASVTAFLGRPTADVVRDAGPPDWIAGPTPAADGQVRLETYRLLLRPSRVEDAVVHRELWLERDHRVPPHRRIGADGRPALEEFEAAIRAEDPSSVRLLAVERKSEGDTIGYCGLVDAGQGAQGVAGPELAFELLRRCWGQGYATEASWAVLDWARSSGHEALWASVWEWNTASRRVLAKLGFVEVAREDGPHGTNLVTTRSL